MDLHVVDLCMILTRWTIYGEQNEPILAADVEVPIPIFLQTKTSRKEKFYQALLFISVYSCNGPNLFIQEGGFRGGVQGVCTFPPPPPRWPKELWYDFTVIKKNCFIAFFALSTVPNHEPSPMLFAFKICWRHPSVASFFCGAPLTPPPQPSPRSSVFIEQRKDLNDMRIEADCINPCFIMLGHQKLLTVEVKCTGK